MGETTVGEHKYRVGRLDAFKQFHVARRLAPVISSVTDMVSIMAARGGAREAGVEALKPLMDAVGRMSNDDADFVIKTCLSAVSRLQQSGSYAPVMHGDTLMFADLDMVAMLSLTWAVIEENMVGFFDAARSFLARAARETGSST